MRILITNDDGIFAPGIAALARGLLAAFGDQHELMVVAPLTDHSGASAAVGAVYDRESIPYESVEIPGLGALPTYGIDASPALGVLLACIEGFGPRPDLVVSGINHGLNAGRSALHSGTVGAALTGAQFGIPGLAVSIAWSSDPVPWETAVGLATGIVPVLAEAEPGAVLNLNVPAVTSGELRGLRHGTLGTIGLIRSVRPERTPMPAEGSAVDRTGGAVTLTLRGKGVPTERLKERAELEPGSDAALVDAGWASITPLVGVHEDVTERGSQALLSALTSQGAG